MSQTSPRQKHSVPNGRRTLSPWGRIVWAVVTIGTVSLTGIWIVDWYQQERPLFEIEAALKLGRTSPAMKLVNQFLRSHPDDARGQCLKARILVDVRQPEEALRIFERYGAVGADDLHVWAKAHLLLREWSNAQAVLERILQLKPDDADALQEVTSCRSFRGDYRAALESASRLTLQPGREVRAWLQIGTLHKNLGNERLTIEAWDRVLKDSPQADNLQVSSSEFFGEFGLVLLSDGQTERARETLERSLALKESAAAHSNLGQALLRLGEEASATAHWKRAMELEPTLHVPREELAQLAFRAGRFEEAYDLLEPILKSPLAASSATYLMERVCQGLNRVDAAQTWRDQTELKRKREKLQSAVNHILIESPESYWSRAVRAYQFAESGNWQQADVLTQTLGDESVREPFVEALKECVRGHGQLPSLELLPIHQF